MEHGLVFGGKCIELSATYEPSLGSSCWKMLQTSFSWGGVMLLEALPKSGMTVNGQLLEVEKTLVPHITEGAGFVLPTPLASDYKRIKPSPSDFKARERGYGLSMPAASMLTEMTQEEIIGKGFRLNPQFVEEMMGYPIGWTELER